MASRTCSHGDQFRIMDSLERYGSPMWQLKIYQEIKQGLYVTEPDGFSKVTHPDILMMKIHHN